MAGPGPMQSTATDFWTMIWEKKSYVVVMLGEPKENGEVRATNVYNVLIDMHVNILIECFI